MKRNAVMVDNVIEPLSSIPFHDDVLGLSRQYARGFPYHIAIHQMNINTSNAWLADAHSHKHEEINIIITGNEELAIEYEIAGEYLILRENKTILIPSDVDHRSRYLSGDGFMVCIILASSKELFANE